MRVCISCEADVSGKKAWPIKEDRIIKAVRTVKKALGIARMNELYVCANCLGKHRARRQAFEKSMLFASVLGGLIVIVMLAMVLISGRLDIWAVVSTIVIGAFVMALPLFRYAPAVQMPPGEPSPGPEPSPLPPLPGGPGLKAQKRRKR
ncbi:MAG: hypothetical protein PHV13_05795 [Candidatus ainarchaeum sp.]|nr:hypothetical protein [Candidatus ainarchaeum sp.]